MLELNHEVVVMKHSKEYFSCEVNANLYTDKRLLFFQQLIDIINTSLHVTKTHMLRAATSHPINGE